MTLRLRVIPKASSNRIIQLSAGSFKVYVTAPAEDNKANKAVIELLAKYFKVRKSQISIIRGKRSHDKAVEIF